MNDKGYDIEVELFKGEDPIDFPSEYEDDFNAAVFGTQLEFDKGKADKAVFYIAKDGELLDIITKSRGEFDIKEMAVAIDNIKEKFGE